ncbi:MAG: hypothetical protein EAZ89_00370 [Bacteroidetes bacterium]|nr:MAG: hypothetical protein EAZ89_00370 [Bacteroidota bacterium]
MPDSNNRGLTPDTEIPGQTQRRNHLLVIGVDGYADSKTWPTLNNAEYDAQAFAKLMTEKYYFSLQPQHQLLGQAATREEILEQFESFTAHGTNKLTDVDNLLVYFAGHGDIRGTRGYWIPRDASTRVGSLVSHDDIWGILRDIHAHHIYLIADACFSGDFVRRSSEEDNRFAANADLFPSRRVLASGRSGQTVRDGAHGQHSPFARVLLSFLSNSPELEIPAEDMELHVKKTVPRLVDKQQPISAYLYGLNDQEGQMVFRKKAVSLTPVPEPVEGPEKIVEGPEKQPAEVISPPATKEERIAWGVAEATNTLEAYQQFLAQYPRGHFSQKANTKADALDEALWKKIAKDDTGFREYLRAFPKRKYSDEAKWLLRVSAQRDWEKLSENISVEGLRNFLKKHPDSEYTTEAEEELEVREEVTLQLAIQQKNPQIYVRLFQGDSYLKRIGFPLPEMLLIKGGEFMMGSEEGEDSEKPIHKVKVSDFYLGKYPVTFEEYDAYCEAAGIEKPLDKGWGRGKRPVINVSWKDATAYCEWLKAQTGQGWRLPTEAEWEYAAGGRSQNRTKWAGTSNEKELGNYAWISDNSGSKTHPVGEKKPNALGLYDMSGNVWEWCSDWYGEYPSSEQTNPQGPPDGEYRVFRGGGWVNRAAGARVSSRGRWHPGDRGHYLGFRLARSI